MAITRILLVLFIGAGLVLAPVRSVSAKCLATAALASESQDMAAPSPHHDCPCCNPVSKCSKANCLTNCAPLNAMGAVTADVFAGHPVESYGLGNDPALGWTARPATPPPQV